MSDLEFGGSDSTTLEEEKKSDVILIVNKTLERDYTRNRIEEAISNIQRSIDEIQEELDLWNHRKRAIEEAVDEKEEVARIEEKYYDRKLVSIKTARDIKLDDEKKEDPGDGKDSTGGDEIVDPGDEIKDPGDDSTSGDDEIKDPGDDTGGDDQIKDPGDGGEIKDPGDSREP